MKNSINFFALILLLTATATNAQIDVKINTKYDIAFKQLEFSKDVEVSFPDVDARNSINEAEKLLTNARKNIQ